MKFTFEGAIIEGVEMLTDLVYANDGEVDGDAKNELEALVYAHKFILNEEDLAFNAKMFFKHVEKLSWKSPLIQRCSRRIDMILSDL